MGEIIDTRPELFLRAMRETGDYVVACQKSGMTADELVSLCRENAQFDRTQTECVLEYHEEKATKTANDTIQSLRKQLQTTVDAARDYAIAQWRVRHRIPVRSESDNG